MIRIIPLQKTKKKMLFSWGRNFLQIRKKVMEKKAKRYRWIAKLKKVLSGWQDFDNPNELIANKALLYFEIKDLIHLRKQAFYNNYNFYLVGMTGFEPATPRTPCVCATRLRHIPLRKNFCRGGRIRTCDLLLPKQARWPGYATPRKFVRRDWDSNPGSTYALTD